MVAVERTWSMIWRSVTSLSFLRIGFGCSYQRLKACQEGGGAPGAPAAGVPRPGVTSVARFGRLVIREKSSTSLVDGYCLRLSKNTPAPTSSTPMRPSTHTGIVGSMETPTTAESIDQKREPIRLKPADAKIKSPIAIRMMANAFILFRTSTGDSRTRLAP